MALYLENVFNEDVYSKESQVLSFQDYIHIPNGFELVQITSQLFGTAIEIYNGGKSPFRVYVSSIPSQCGICIVSGLTSINPTTLQFVSWLCSQMGYSQMLYTVNTEQEGIIKALVENGFSVFSESSTRNARSGNIICIYYKNIEAEFPESDEDADDDSWVEEDEEVEEEDY